MHRKGTPNRSPTLTDITPGIVFRVYPFIVSRTWEGEGCFPSLGFSPQSFDEHSSSMSSFNSSPALGTHAFTSAVQSSSNNNNSNSNNNSIGRGVTMRRRFKSLDISAFNSSQPGFFRRSSVQPDQQQQQQHHHHLFVVPSQFSGSGSSYLNSDSDDPDIAGSDCDLQQRRRASASGNANNSGSSLLFKHKKPRPAHLIPNKLLSTTSRRISASSIVEGRVCAACFAKTTPYWRDGWSEDCMLCNACGLRFQKFMKRCEKCSYIPRKEDQDCATCPNCNSNWI